MEIGEPVIYREQEAKSITRLAGVVDPWFLGRYGMNLYRGCQHACAYCDGRAERYFVQGDFAREIVVKKNAVAVLRSQLRRAREPGFLLLGGGVCDSYQPAEIKYELARGVLRLALEQRFPVHIITKSILVERDLEILAEINNCRRAILSFSVQTGDDSIRAIFEPGASPIGARLEVMRKAKKLGLGVGAMAMPVLPGISDKPEQIDRLVKVLADIGVDFVCFGGLTLRPGAQKSAYLNVIEKRFPDLLAGYRRVYRSERNSGAPDSLYVDRVHARFIESLEKYRLPSRPPRRLFHRMMPLYSEVGVLLEHRYSRTSRSTKVDSTLKQAGSALQEWGRRRLSGEKGRVKGLTWVEVESEFLAALRENTLAREIGVNASATKEMQDLANSCE